MANGKAEPITGKDAVDYVRNHQIVEVDVASSLATKEVMAALKLVKEAKESKFKDTEPDFWKPGGTDKAGKAYPKKVRGVYLGWQKSRGSKLIQHALGCLNEKGKPFALRFNGTAQLTRELQKIAREDWGTVAAGIEIEYLGQGAPSQGVNEDTGEVFPKAGLREFRVTRLEE